MSPALPGPYWGSGGLGPAGGLLGYEMFGRKRDEQERARQQQQMQNLLRALRPTTETTQEPFTTQQRTGRYQVGAPISPSPSLADALGGLTDYPIPGPGYLDQPDAGPPEYTSTGPGYLEAPLEYPTPGPGYFGQQAYQPPAPPPTERYAQAFRPPSLYGPGQEPAPRIAWPNLPPEIINPQPEPPFSPFVPEPPPPPPAWAQETEPGLGLEENWMRMAAARGLQDPRVSDMAKSDVYLPPGMQPQPVTPPPAPEAFVPPIKPEPAPKFEISTAAPRREPIERVPVLTGLPYEGRETEPVTRMQSVTRTVPGKQLLDLIMQDPMTMLTLLKQNPELGKLIEQEQARQQWQTFVQGVVGGPGGPGAVAPGVGVAPSVATGTAAVGPAGTTTAGAPGTAPAEGLEERRLALAQARLDRLQPMMDALDADPTGSAAMNPQAKAFRDQYKQAVDDVQRISETVTKARAARVTERKAAREEQEATADQEWARTRVEGLRVEGRHVEADALEAAARDPKYADALGKARESEDKRKEPLKPTVIDGQPYLPTTDPKTGEITGYKKLPGVTEPEKAPILIEGQPYRVVRNEQGEPVMQALPGVPQKAAKPWYEGITRAEAEAMSKDPTLPPERRAQARQLADALQSGAEKTAKEGAPRITIGTEERQANIYADVTARAAERIGDMLDEKKSGNTYTQYLGPSRGIGPFRLSGEERYAYAEREGTVAPEQGMVKAAFAGLQNRLNRATNGARASDADIIRIQAETPTLNDTPEVARRKYAMAMENLQFLEEAAAKHQGRPSRYEQETGQRPNVLPPRKNGGAAAPTPGAPSLPGPAAPPTSTLKPPGTTPVPSTPQGQSLLERH